MKQNARGFSLLELMITLTIVAILASIAIPNYSDYMRKSRRNEAMQALNATRNALEKFRLSQNAYPASITAMNAIITSHGLKNVSGIWMSENSYYVITLTTDVGGAVTGVTAQVQGSQVADGYCQTMSLSMAGVPSSTDSTGAASTDLCWRS